VLAQQRLSFDDGLALYGSRDVLAVGWLANHVRERMHGDVTYFNVNRHINPTNVCVAACKLCAFGRKKGDPAGYTMALEEAWETAASGYSEAVTEFHIVGGLHPDLPLEFFLDLVRGSKSASPRCTSRPSPWWRSRSWPGAPSSPSRDADQAARGRRGLHARRRRGDLCRARPLHHLRPQDRRRRVARDRAHWRTSWASSRTRPCCTATLKTTKTASITCSSCAPAGRDRRLPDLHSAGVSSRKHAARSPAGDHGLTDIRQIAVSRLLLDNFPHIKAYWQMMTPKIAQISLRFGADDLDGTVIEEKIYHDAGATTPQGMTRKELCRLITEAGRVPVERDTLYHAVTRTEDSFTVAVYDGRHSRLGRIKRSRLSHRVHAHIRSKPARLLYRSCQLRLGVLVRRVQHTINHPVRPGLVDLHKVRAFFVLLPHYLHKLLGIVGIIGIREHVLRWIEVVGVLMPAQNVDGIRADTHPRPGNDP
jgi:aminodeoxyfutalosine synthase